MRQFEVLVENKIGALADVCEVLAKANVNIKAVSTEERPKGKGVIKFIVDNEKLAREVLQAVDFNFNEFEVILVKLVDRAGELAKISRAMANLGINIQSTFILNKENGLTEIAMKVDNLIEAKCLLNK